MCFLSAFAAHLTVKSCPPKLVVVRYLDFNLHMVAFHHDIPTKKGGILSFHTYLIEAEWCIDTLVM